MTYQTDGILLIDKDEGETSYDVVRKVKSALDIKKVGHAGTLDPFATGLLIILIGQGTKLSSFIMSNKKSYVATLRLGTETDTLDRTGKVIKTSTVPELSKEYIREKVCAFQGEIEQTPPVYSAIKLKGARAYKLARRGEEVFLEKRRVLISALDIVSVSLPDVCLEVECSSGTYIRSLAADLGVSLGTGGHLVSLRRTACGPFSVDKAQRSRDVGRQSFETLQEGMIPLISVLTWIPQIEISRPIAKAIRLGKRSALSEIVRDLNQDCETSGLIKLICSGELVAVLKANTGRRDGHGRLEILRVFS
ncbi:tRNA pseudouridine synthase B [uncultured Desulfobacterium sp.]|uniref:tRNA pseudouridine synthase B n=1 Tax=uncultured Desulfobacterium sp. TaxID=201089 RepID=A0A445MZL7_9BACT|nr:tRNA pseudouridine synthase B [uncultured Desulfobacterium sp.]